MTVPSDSFIPWELLGFLQWHRSSLTVQPSSEGEESEATRAGGHRVSLSSCDATRVALLLCAVCASPSELLHGLLSLVVATGTAGIPPSESQDADDEGTESAGSGPRPRPRTVGIREAAQIGWTRTTVVRFTSVLLSAISPMQAADGTGADTSVAGSATAMLARVAGLLAGDNDAGALPALDAAWIQ